MTRSSTDDSGAAMKRAGILFLGMIGAAALGCDTQELGSQVGSGGSNPGSTSTGSSSSGGGAGQGGGGSQGEVWQPRLGANIDGSAVVFSVWAPHATSAWVEGSFNGGKVAMAPGDDGVWKARVEGAGAGTTYRFVFDSPSGTINRLDPYCQQIEGDHCLVIDHGAYPWKTASFQRPDRAHSVVYEMHVGSFSVPQGAAQGTLSSARAELPRLADLGVDVVELMPVQAFGGKPNGWGYNPQLYFAPKPTYGSADDLRAFIDDAHGRGIAVWLDTVVNHYDGWSQAPLVCFDGYCSGAAGIYFFGQGPYQSTPWGPRPDYTNPQVSGMLLDAVDWWLLAERGDGFRWDSTSNIRALDGMGTTPGGKELLVAANDRTHARGALGVAEDLKGSDTLTKPADQGGLGFDAQWDGFCWQVTGVLQVADDNARDMGVIQGAITGAYAGDGFARLLFTEDHDTVGNGGARLPVKIDSVNPTSFAARKRSMLGAVMLLSAPGVPMLFMGQEALATAGFTSPPAPLPAPSGPGLQIQAFYKDMIRLRRDQDGDSAGLVETGVEVFHRNDGAKVIAYRRHGPSGQDVIVILNYRNKSYPEYDIGVPDKGPWRVRLDTDWKAYGDDFSGGQQGSITAFAALKDGKPFTLPLKLAAYSAMVLTR